MDAGILSNIRKFADDKRLIRAVGDKGEAVNEDLNMFYLEKCSVMQMGK